MILYMTDDLPLALANGLRIQSFACAVVYAFSILVEVLEDYAIAMHVETV
jgi:hypothetical protein